MKKLLFAFVLLVLTGGWANCEKPVISIGAINPLTGKFVQHGIELDYGIQYAVKEANLKESFQINLIRRDDKSLPDVAMQQAEDLIVRGKVVALVGGYVDTLVGSISTVAIKHKVPYVASASLESKLNKDGGLYFFRISHIEGITQPIIDFIEEVIKPKRVALIYASTPGATEFAHIIREHLKGLNIPLVLDEKVRPGTPDFSSFLMKCKREEVEFFISAIFLADHMILVRQMKDLEVPIKGYLGPWGIAYDSFIKEMKEKAEHLFGMVSWYPGITFPGTEEESKRFVEGYKKMFNVSPTSTSMHGYVSAKVVIEAIKKLVDEKKPINPEELAKVIKTTNIVTPMGNVAFDEKGDPKFYKQIIVQIQNGALVPVFPTTFSNRQ